MFNSEFVIASQDEHSNIQQHHNVFHSVHINRRSNKPLPKKEVDSSSNSDVNIPFFDEIELLLEQCRKKSEDTMYVKFENCLSITPKVTQVQENDC